MSPKMVTQYKGAKSKAFILAKGSAPIFAFGEFYSFLLFHLDTDTFISFKSEKSTSFRSVLIRMFTNFGGELVFSADLCYNGANRKPPSEREVARVA